MVQRVDASERYLMNEVDQVAEKMVENQLLRINKNSRT